MTARFGFGCYRVTVQNEVHEAALRRALSFGVDVIDTSSNYSNGDSERLVGKVLSTDYAAQQKQPLVITKIGYAQGDVLSMILAHESLGEPYEETVKISETLRHCIHPSFLNDVFESSLARLQMTRVNVLLLHNPEYFLQLEHQRGSAVDGARNIFYNRILKSFEWLEQQKSDGRIDAYGISSNTFGHSMDEPDFVSLERCIEIAQLVGGEHNGFRYAEMPFNLVEHFVATNINQTENNTTLDVALQKGVAVVVNRPLNAIVGTDMIRLASHDIPLNAPDVETLDARVHQMEIFEHDAFQQIVAGIPDNERQTVQESFRIGAALCQSWMKFEGLLHWRDVRKLYLEPRLRNALIHGGDMGAEYFAEMIDIFTGIDAVYSAQENESLEVLRTSMCSVFELPRDTPLQHIALHSVRCTKGVDIVLVGMRTSEYVDDVMSVKNLPEITFDLNTWKLVEATLHEISGD